MNPFKGYDWTELIEYWNVQIPQDEFPDFDGDEPDWDNLTNYPVKGGYSYSDWYDNEASEEYKEYMKGYAQYEKDVEYISQQAIRNYMHSSYEKEWKQKIASDLRLFITALRDQSDKIDFQTPVWNALLEIKDDYTLLSFVELLIPAMWT